MVKIQITPEKIKELFGKYDDCLEEPVECGTRLRSFLKDLVNTQSIADSRKEKTTRILETLKQNIEEAKKSQEANELDPSSLILSDKRKQDEKNLRLTITQVKEWLNTLTEDQKLAKLTFKYAIIASVLGCLAGIGAAYALFILYPFSTWVLGQYTWQIGLVVALIITAFVWKPLRYNSSVTQVVAAILMTPLVTVIATTFIVLAASAVMAGALTINGDPGFDLYFASQAQLPSFGSLVQSIFSNVISAVAFILSIVVGLIIAILAGRLERLALGVRALKPKKVEEQDNDSS